MKPLSAWLLVIAVALGIPVRAALLPVPNASFEMPATSFVLIGIDDWQKTPKAPGYDESGGFFWVQLTGLFSNTPPGNFDHIVNCDGSQAVWLFAVPEVGLFQDYDSIGSTVTNASRAFNVIYRPDHSYRLTVGVMGAGGGMLEGAPLQLGLYYRDTASNRVLVAATTVTNSALFAARTNFFDYSVRVPPVPAGSAWAGKNLGIQFLSTVTPEMEGGYWVLDHVRLEEFPPPQLTNLTHQAGAFGFTLVSEPGQPVEILASTNAALPWTAWTSLGTVTNLTGTTNLNELAPGVPARYYRTRLSVP